MVADVQVMNIVKSQNQQGDDYANNSLHFGFNSHEQTIICVCIRGVQLNRLIGLFCSCGSLSMVDHLSSKKNSTRGISKRIIVK